MKRLNSLQAFSLALVAALPLIVPFSGHNAASANNAFDGPEPLAPEIAFSPEISRVDANAVTIRYHIEDGYYLYRDKLAFSVVGAEADSGPDSIKLGTPEYDTASVINDDFFGEQAIFRDVTDIVLPYSSDASVTAFTLAIKYQGCADMGLCYPPNTVNLDIKLPTASSSVSLSNFFTKDQLADSSSSVQTDTNTESLTQSLEADDWSNDILPPELAYLPQIVSAHKDAVDVRWFIEDGYYLYRDKISFSIENTDGLLVDGGLISPGAEQFDEFFGNVQVLRQDAQARVLLTSAGANLNASARASDATLKIHYQGCADIGICFPPTTATLPVSFNNGSSGPANGELIKLVGAIGTGSNSGGGSSANQSYTTTAATGNSTNTSAAPLQSEQDRLTSLLGNASIWLTIATFFGLGLLLAFTPCVLPMVPILSSLIIGQKESVSTSRAFQLSAVYVLVMASTYALVGIAVGLSGYNIQAFLQHPAVLTTIAGLFVILSLSMFGFYELQMPTGLQTKLTQWSNKQGGGQLGGVAAMGFISTLIVGPCITAPLAGALLYIAKTGDAVVGGAALFALGLGMGAPLLLIGTSAGKLVPSAGPWMNKVKHIFGIMMLAMAIYMVSRFLPSSVTMALYAVLAISSGIYLGALNPITHNKHRQIIGKTAGIAVGLYGVALLVSAMAGGTSYLRPLSAFTSAGNYSNAAGNAQEGEHALPFQIVKSVAELEQVVSDAREQGRPVMLDFYADWCISCKEMEAFTFTDGRVQELLSNAVLLQADVTANDGLDQALLKHFDLFGPPGIIFYDGFGTELAPARVVGFMNADNFSSHIERFIGRPFT